MKRSEINAAIAATTAFFRDHQFVLPSFAYWTYERWSELGAGSEEFYKRKLGWDVTDFASGRFHEIGLTLFSLRNGAGEGSDAYPVYAEKILHVREGQVTPLHFHYHKMEDLINRGGPGTGNLAIEVYPSTDAGELADTPVTLLSDGVYRQVRAGETFLLHHGESVTMPPRIYHSFHAVNGPCLIGEVSSRNDDASDNHFYEAIPRFPAIEEDAPPLRLLCAEYPDTTHGIQNR